MAISGIYAIVNKVNGHRYVGSAVDIPNRWRSHVYHLRKRNHHSKHLQSAWDLYGKDNFEFMVLEMVDSVDNLLQIEQRYLDAGLPEYNTNTIAGNVYGYRFSDEAKRRMFETHSGFRHTEESKQKMSEIWSGRPRGEYAIARCAKIAAAHRGKTPNDNQKAALEIGRHRIPTEEERGRISESQKGHVPTEETRRKLSAARRKRITTELTKQKTSESMKRFYVERKAAASAGSTD